MQICPLCAAAGAPVLKPHLASRSVLSLRAPDLCLSNYYMANTLNGRGKSRQKGNENGKPIPVTYWGQYQERERDRCEPDPDGYENACCEAPEVSNWWVRGGWEFGED